MSRRRPLGPPMSRRGENPLDASKADIAAIEKAWASKVPVRDPYGNGSPLDYGIAKLEEKAKAGTLDAGDQAELDMLLAERKALRGPTQEQLQRAQHVYDTDCVALGKWPADKVVDVRFPTRLEVEIVTALGHVAKGNGQAAVWIRLGK